MKDLRIGTGLVVIVVSLLISGIACTNYTIPGKDSSRISAKSCEGCHTDYARLQEVYSPDTVAGPGG